MRLLIVLSLLILQINLISSARVHSKSEIDCSPHHNDHRKNLLEYDFELAERALELAKIYETNQLSGRKTEGINYYTEETDSDSDFDDDYLCEAAVSSWFDEISHYNSLDTDSRIRSNKNKYFHYIQLSWNTTESVGCGYAQSNNRFTVACVYRNKSNMSNSIKKHVPVNSFEKNLLKKNYEDLCHIGPVFYDYTQSQADKTKVHNKIIKTKQYCANIDDDDDDYDGRQNNRRRNQDDDEEDFNNEDKKKNNGRNNRNDNNNRNDRNNRNDNNNRNDRNNRNENKNNTRNNDPEFKKLNDKLDRLEKLVQNLKNSSHTNNNNNNNNNRTTRRRRIVRRRLIPFPF